MPEFLRLTTNPVTLPDVYFSEQYRVFASRDVPCALVRAEFPTGLVDELMEMTEAADRP